MVALNSRQLRFAQKYWETGNATQSAKDAGYSEKSAYAQGSALLKDPRIRAKIKEYEEESRMQLQQQFSRDAVVARKIMFNIMKDPDAPESVRYNAAKDFLDRAGFKPTDKSEVDLKADVDIAHRSEMFERYLKDD